MLDFTSALYLGMHHPSETLEPWEQFTTGVPAALETPRRARTLATAIANLQGCERATLGTSTLHLFWDLFGMLAGESVAIYMDDGVYPIARWGIERAAARGSEIRTFPHHDAGGLHSLLLKGRRPRQRLVVVSDGFCTGCGRHAPIADYLELARNFEGQLVMDDTQAIGIFGHGAGPYGRGGGGTLRLHGLKESNAVVVCSLAKGFGVPVATLSGNAASVRSFEARSDTRVHCSPPSMAVIQAGAHALNLNRTCGDQLRHRLAQLVGRFRCQLRDIGFQTIGGLFPLQTLAPSPGFDPTTLHEHLLSRGIKTVLRSSRCGSGALLSFIITARHNLEQIERAICTVAAASDVDVTKKNLSRQAKHLVHQINRFSLLGRKSGGQE